MDGWTDHGGMKGKHAGWVAAGGGKGGRRPMLRTCTELLNSTDIEYTEFERVTRNLAKKSGEPCCGAGSHFENSLSPADDASTAGCDRDDR